jgi:hypothetical protein
MARWVALGAALLVWLIPTTARAHTDADRAAIRAAALDYVDGWYTGVYQNAASVKVVASDWIDYLHLARWNGTWKIVNVLWELEPESPR